MKKSVIIAIVVAAVLVLGGGSVFAASQLAKSSAISEDTALNFALVDAGVLPEEVEFLDINFEFEKGKFVYDVEFLAGGNKYEYTIDSKTGSVIEKEVEKIPDLNPQPSTPSGEPATDDASKEMITVDQAKVIALNAAEISDGTIARITKAELDEEDGRAVYEVEIAVGISAEYDFTIDAYSGEIIEKSYEEFDTDEEESSDDAIPVPDPQPLPSPDSATPDDSSKQAISVEQAKFIALQHAVLSANEVSFRKAMIETDNGRLFYEINFFISGVREYEYEIDAYTGEIIDVDVDEWDDEEEDD